MCESPVCILCIFYDAYVFYRQLVTCIFTYAFLETTYNFNFTYIFV